MTFAACHGWPQESGKKERQLRQSGLEHLIPTPRWATAFDSIGRRAADSASQIVNACASACSHAAAEAALTARTRLKRGKGEQLAAWQTLDLQVAKQPHRPQDRMRTCQDSKVGETIASAGSHAKAMSRSSSAHGGGSTEAQYLHQAGTRNARFGRHSNRPPMQSGSCRKQFLAHIERRSWRAAVAP